MDSRERRALEGNEQRACRLERDRERARHRRQRQGPEARVSERLRARARRAREGREERARRLQCNRERERERRQRQGATVRASARLRMRTRRAQERNEQRACRLELERERARRSREQQGAEARESERVRTRERRAQEGSQERARRFERHREQERERRQQQGAEARELEQVRSTLRRALEDSHEHNARLQIDRNRAAQRRHENIPIFGQKSVVNKISAFHTKMSQCTFNICSTCSESVLLLASRTSQSECSRCSRDEKSPKLYSVDNNMHPGDVPPELQGLTQVEEMLISAVMPMMSLYHLPYGQYGYSGHVINLPQDVSTFTSTLPRSPSQLDVLIVRKQDAHGAHKDFRVRRTKIYSALLWLKSHNVYYHNIAIDESVLSQLPLDGDIANVPTIVDEAITHENQSTQEDSNEELLAGTFVPMLPRQTTEEEMIRQSIDRTHVSWPHINQTPLNEFRTEGYMSLAFPTLYPTGMGHNILHPCNYIKDMVNLHVIVNKIV